MAFLEIIYRDADVIVLNKPSGLLSVPGVVAERFDSLATRVQSVLPNARVVHRLDCDTSGLMIMALNPDSQRELNRQFRAREIDKHYLAWVYGCPPEAQGRIELPLIKDWPNRPKQKVDFVNGKESITDWQVLKREHNRSLIELKPITGRSHQLRLHMKEIGHPILGDRLYADATALGMASRLQLHAQRLRFRHPVTAETLSFCAANDWA